MAKRYVIDQQPKSDPFKAVDDFTIIKSITKLFWLVGLACPIGKTTVQRVGQHVRGIHAEHAMLLGVNEDAMEILKQERRALLCEAFENGRRLGAAELKGKFEP